MLHRYQIDLRVKEGNTEKTIKKSIFRKKELTDVELEEAQLEFIRSTKAIVNREIIRHEIRKNERKIKILEWVLEG